MSASASSNVRTIAWSIGLGFVVTLSWLKNAQNQNERDEQAAWHQRIRGLQSESAGEHQRLTKWLRALGSQSNARRQIEDKLNNGNRLPVKKDGEYEAARWSHPKYGIQVELTFFGNQLVASGVSSGTAQLLTVYPQPSQTSFSGSADLIRRQLLPYLVAAWLVATMVAVALRRFGRVAAEFMLVISLAYGAALLVSPLYAVTAQGVISNDGLFSALLMYLASVTALALRTPLRCATIRFKLRTLMAATAAVAVLVALRPVGYVALAAFMLGGLLFLVTLKFRVGYATAIPVRPSPKADAA